MWQTHNFGCQYLWVIFLSKNWHLHSSNDIPGLKLLMPLWLLLTLHLKFMNQDDCKTQAKAQIICCATTVTLLAASGSLPISSVTEKQNFTSSQLLVRVESSSRFPLKTTLCHLFQHATYLFWKRDSNPTPPNCAKRLASPLHDLVHLQEPESPDSLNSQLKYSEWPLPSKNQRQSTHSFPLSSRMQ